MEAATEMTSIELSTQGKQRVRHRESGDESRALGHPHQGVILNTTPQLQVGSPPPVVVP
jgi:hypothetical protein